MLVMFALQGLPISRRTANPPPQRRAREVGCTAHRRLAPVSKTDLEVKSSQPKPVLLKANKCRVVTAPTCANRPAAVAARPHAVTPPALHPQRLVGAELALNQPELKPQLLQLHTLSLGYTATALMCGETGWSK